MAQKQIRVLLIDGDPHTQEIVRTFFEHYGHSVLNASGREDGLALAHSSLPDVIIAEMYTPCGQIPKLLRELRAQFAVPIITMSAHALIEDRERALAAGADRYLSKPVEPRVVLDVVEALVKVAE